MSVFEPLSHRRATERQLIVFVRQSTHQQRKSNQGSGKLQMTLVEVGRQLGWPPERITVLDARGESGSRGPRELFNDVLKRVKSGRVGAVAFARGDRIGRTALESEDLLRAAADNRTLIITEGRIYSPASASDKLILGMLTQVAEYENRARTMWMMATRFTLAKEGAYRIVMPTGLIAGSPEDPVFVKRLTEAGLASWLNNLEAHKAVSTREGKPFYVLPYPDREVFEACRMRMDCMLTNGDLDAVVELINTDPDYPRPGFIPVVARAVRRYHDRILIKWVDMNHPYGRQALRKWFQSPAVYGVYTYNARKLARTTGDGDKDRFKVRIENAFPAFATAADGRRIRRIMEEDKKPWRMGAFHGPRTHLLSMLRCAHGAAEGDVCGKRMHAMYQPDGTYGYYSHACRYTDHPTQHIKGHVVDDAVLETLLPVLDRERLERALNQLQVAGGIAKTRLRGIEADLQEATRSVKGLTRAVAQAELDSAEDRKAVLNEELDEAIKRQQAIESAIHSARADLRDFSALAASDRKRILALASDIPRLIEETQERHPALRRMLISEMVNTIHFNRVSGYAFEMDLTFPGGAKIRRSVLSRNMRVKRAALEWAAGKLSEGLDPNEIAAELNKAPLHNHHVPWTDERVNTAPYAMEHQELPPLRQGPHENLADIAQRLGVGYEAVFLAAVGGYLGPGQYRDGDLYLKPSLEELHRTIPEAAKRHVAKEMNWPIRDTVPRAEVSKRTGLSRYKVTTMARKRSGLGQDAASQHWVRVTDFDLEPKSG